MREPGFLKDAQVFSGTHWLVALVPFQIVEKPPCGACIREPGITAIGALDDAANSQLLRNCVEFVVLGQRKIGIEEPSPQLKQPVRVRKTCSFSSDER